MYNQKVTPALKNQMILSDVVSNPKYSAMPPQTPAITRLLFDLYNLVGIISPPYVMTVRVA